jgi:hypothetical protein
MKRSPARRRTDSLAARRQRPTHGRLGFHHASGVRRAAIHSGGPAEVGGGEPWRRQARDLPRDATEPQRARQNRWGHHLGGVGLAPSDDEDEGNFSKTRWNKSSIWAGFTSGKRWGGGSNDSDASPHPPPSEESESCPKIGITHFSWAKSQNQKPVRFSGTKSTGPTGDRCRSAF